VVYTVYGGNVYGGGANTLSGGNPRTIRVRSDNTGTQYVAFINALRDSLIINKTLDHGMTWLNLQSFTLTGGSVWQGVDFYIADSANTIKLGIAATVTSGASMMDGTLYFILINNDGSGFRWNTVDIPAGRGYINPCIVSDAYHYDPELTYWYIGYQDYSSSTPANNPVRAAVTPDWGVNWNIKVARSGYNDYDVDIEIGKHDSGDSVYVLLTNNLTLSNPNLRIRKTLLSNFGAAWAQYNPANSTAPEYYGSMTINRQTGDMVVAYTVVNSGIHNLGCTFTNKKEGKYFQPNLFVANNTYNESNAVVDCNQYDGIFRFIYTANGGTFDSLIYKSTSDLNSGTFTKTVFVNTGYNASSTIFPDVSGADITAYGSNGFVIFAGKEGGLFHTYSDIIIPVELTSFKAFISGNSAVLNWSTASETNNSGFTVEYKKESGDWTEAGFVSGRGTTTETHNYNYTINELGTGNYSFRLKQMDYDGSFAYSGVIESEITGNLNFELYQNYPNPFNPSTEILYSVKERGIVSIRIYDMLGREISTIVNEIKDAGLHSVKFDGSSLASGVYMYSISVNDYNAVRKMILNK
jgi:hypothetical protein